MDNHNSRNSLEKFRNLSPSTTKSCSNEELAQNNNSNMFAYAQRSSQQQHATDLSIGLFGAMQIDRYSNTPYTDATKCKKVREMCIIKKLVILVKFVILEQCSFHFTMSSLICDILL